MAGRRAFGAKLYRREANGNGEWPEGWVRITNAFNIERPSLEKEEIEVTDHDSPDGYREYIPGLKEGGNFSAELNWRPKHDKLVMEDYESDRVWDYRIVFPTSQKHAWTFPAFVTSYESELDVEEKMEAQVEWKVAGKPDLSKLEPNNGDNGDEEGGED